MRVPDMACWPRLRPVTDAAEGPAPRHAPSSQRGEHQLWGLTETLVLDGNAGARRKAAPWDLGVVPWDSGVPRVASWDSCLRKAAPRGGRVGGPARASGRACFRTRGPRSPWPALVVEPRHSSSSTFFDFFGVTGSNLPRRFTGRPSRSSEKYDPPDGPSAKRLRASKGLRRERLRNKSSSHRRSSPSRRPGRRASQRRPRPTSRGRRRRVWGLRRTMRSPHGIPRAQMASDTIKATWDPYVHGPRSLARAKDVHKGSWNGPSRGLIHPCTGPFRVQGTVLPGLAGDRASRPAQRTERGAVEEATQRRARARGLAKTVLRDRAPAPCKGLLGFLARARRLNPRFQEEPSPALPQRPLGRFFVFLSETFMKPFRKTEGGLPGPTQGAFTRDRVRGLHKRLCERPCP
ncbi:hypothetical protein M885DRAFT_99423 [Pelagophyceae sp. CCMP2097]|nr:hypothetical protein M885DRAFT_99423 [Pelagophyceae sp. CCMP2097]